MESFMSTSKRLLPTANCRVMLALSCYACSFMKRTSYSDIVAAASYDSKMIFEARGPRRDFNE
jgi:hypothetical protein